MSKINLNNEFYVFSTHKTATQSLNTIFKTCHIHELSNANYTKKEFIKDTEKYFKMNNKKLKILTVLRLPSQRVISSYFQIKHTDEIFFFNKKENETSIARNDINFLVNDVREFIKKRKYPKEALYEIMDIFNFKFTDINVNQIKNYGFYENDLIELYILDYESIIKNYIYLENIFGIKFTSEKANISSEKKYYKKYKEVKRKIGDEFNEFIDSEHTDLITLKNYFK
jgi:hypothetical protein